MKKAVFLLSRKSTGEISEEAPSPLYRVFLMEGKGAVNVDFIPYSFDGPIVLFTTPYQVVSMDALAEKEVQTLSFHGDYYCIEYHRKEVACNGLLFNNIYSPPFVALTQEEYTEFSQLYSKMADEHTSGDPYSDSVLKSYLQLFLAIASKIKQREVPGLHSIKAHQIEAFKPLLEKHFLEERSVAFYADQLCMTLDTFARKCNQHFNRSPSQMIQERVILEAKKLLHLSLLSIKEIATRLKFDDEHYFSRYFRKNTGIAATTFRRKVGISIVAA